jgi:hypothetical protein
VTRSAWPPGPAAPGRAESEWPAGPAASGLEEPLPRPDAAAGGRAGGGRSVTRAGQRAGTRTVPESNLNLPECSTTSVSTCRPAGPQAGWRRQPAGQPETRRTRTPSRPRTGRRGRPARAQCRSPDSRVKFIIPQLRLLSRLQEAAALNLNFFDCYAVHLPGPKAVDGNGHWPPVGHC